MKAAAERTVTLRSPLVPPQASPQVASASTSTTPRIVSRDHHITIFPSKPGVPDAHWGEDGQEQCAGLCCWTVAPDLKGSSLAYNGWQLEQRTTEVSTTMVPLRDAAQQSYAITPLCAAALETYGGGRVVAAGRPVPHSGRLIAKD
jgi:hypothetical protein